MAKHNSHDELLNAPTAQRPQIAESLYNEWHSSRSQYAMRQPSQRRLRRIARYQSIIGRGHQAILEVGCGWGDLTYALVGHAKRIVGTDISVKAIELAETRKPLWLTRYGQITNVEFKQMSAVELDFPDETFDWVISTSMIEHLHPDDVETHLREIRRILKARGSYLIWCPNGLGHHGDRTGHFTMLSYSEWMEKLAQFGFRRFRSTLTSRFRCAFQSIPRTNVGICPAKNHVESSGRAQRATDRRQMNRILPSITRRAFTESVKF